jgi:hypothetical protein
MKKAIILILFATVVILSSCARATCPTYTKDIVNTEVKS